MKEEIIKVKNLMKIICAIAILSFFSTSCLFASEQNTVDAAIESPSDDNNVETNSVVDKSKLTTQEAKVEELKDQAQEAKTEVETAKKEAEISEKAVELEKKKAEIKRKEAEAAQKEVEIAKETAESKAEVEIAIEKAKQEEKQALAAKEKVKLAEQKMLTAQEKAKIAQEELKLAQERAAIAESKIKDQPNLVHEKLFQTGLIVLIGYLSMFVLVRVINRRVKDLKLKHLTRRNVVYILNVLIILYIVFLWVQNISSITIFLSVISAGVVLVLQDPILSIAGWFFILVRRPFEVGDRVELAAVKGDVIDIRMLQTSLLEIGNWVEADQSTGRIVNVPNSAVFKRENYNYSSGFEFIWNEIKILVTFESDWKRAEKIMLNHGQTQADGMGDVVKDKIRKMTSRYMIRYEKLTPIVYVEIKDSGVQLTLRYLTEARKRRTTQDMLSRMILSDFEKEDKVSFAYPTYRIVK
ncbi:MAG: mechanosensitive ion channel domain-containing protein [Sedimentisphaerales bacterium]